MNYRLFFEGMRCRVMVCQLGLSLLIALWVIQAAQAEVPGSYIVTVNGTRAQLKLVFQRPTPFTVRNIDRGTILRFNRQINGLDLSGAGKSLSPWVDEIWAGFDSILIQTKPNVTVVFEQRGGHIYGSFNKVQPKLSPSRPIRASSELALGRAKALLALKSRRPIEAKTRIQNLMKKFPDDTQLILDLARVEESLGHWRKALSLYEQAQIIRPSSSDIAEATKRLRTVNGARVVVSTEYMETGDSSFREILHLKGRVRRGDHVVSAVYTRTEAVEKTVIQGLSGNRQPFALDRGVFSVAFETPISQHFQTYSLFSDGEGLGAGWTVEIPVETAHYQIDVNLRKPWLETPESVLGYGYVDQVKFGFRNDFYDHISTYLALSLNSYGLKDANAAANSRRFQLGARYYFSPTKEGFALGVALDNESIFDVETRTNEESKLFRPLQISSRELYLADIGWHKKIGNKWSVTSKLGYESDRNRQSHAPFGQVHGLYLVKPHIQLDFWLTTGVQSYFLDDKNFARLGSNLTWLFD